VAGSATTCSSLSRRTSMTWSRGNWVDTSRSTPRGVHAADSGSAAASAEGGRVRGFPPLEGPRCPAGELLASPATGRAAAAGDAVSRMDEATRSGVPWGSAVSFACCSVIRSVRSSRPSTSPRIRVWSRTVRASGPVDGEARSRGRVGEQDRRRARGRARRRGRRRAPPRRGRESAQRPRPGWRSRRRCWCRSRPAEGKCPVSPRLARPARRSGSGRDDVPLARREGNDGGEGGQQDEVGQTELCCHGDELLAVVVGHVEEGAVDAVQRPAEE